MARLPLIAITLLLAGCACPYGYHPTPIPLACTEDVSYRFTVRYQLWFFRGY